MVKQIQGSCSLNEINCDYGIENGYNHGLL